MGQTLQQLAKRKLSSKAIFPNRFVIEICEKVHTHYKNLRFTNSMYDWVNLAEGFRDALDRWKKRGCPGTNKDRHIELCRKKIINEDELDTLQINLNNNLYNQYEGKVFAEGSEIKDDQYIHLKIRDVRMELTIDDFKELCNAAKEAEEKLKSICVSSVL